MCIRDSNGRLYVTLNQTDMTFQPATEPQIELAVINTQTDKVERVIYEKASGILSLIHIYPIEELEEDYPYCFGKRLDKERSVCLLSLQTGRCV